MTARQQESTLRRLIAQTHAAGVRLAAQLRGLALLNARRRARLAALEHQPTPGHLPVHRYGLDYTALDPATVARTGATFVCRYLSNPGNAKNLTRNEARALARRGIDKVLVWETWANRALDGHEAGAQDARAAHALAIACGAPADCWIYFAVDYDTAGNPGATDAYFDGVASVLGHRGGPYGSYELVRHQLNRGATIAWQTYAWSGGQWDPRAQLQQYWNENAYDHDRSTTAHFGQWR